MAGTLYNSFDVTVTMAVAANTYTAIRSIQIYDAFTVCTGASVGGTMTVSTPGGALSDAMLCAVDEVVVRADTLDASNNLVAAAGVLTVTANAAADRGTVVCRCFISGSGVALA
jgi:hypothetical protein